MATPDDNPFAVPDARPQAPAPPPSAPLGAPSEPTPQPGPAPYQAPPPQPAHPTPPRTDGGAIAAFILSILGVIPLVSVIALVLGWFARSSIQRTGRGGYGLATAAVVIGAIGTAAWLFTVVFLVAAALGSTAG